MLSYNKNQHRQPIGGHHYPDGVMTFRADSFDELKAKVRSFRIANALPVADPEQDILRFYAKNFPYVVIADGKPASDCNGGRYEAWRDWVFATWRNPPKKLIVSKDAERRWEECAACPHNHKIKGGNAAETKEIEKRAYLLRKGVDIPKNLGFCSHHKADLGVFTFIDNAKAHSAASKDGDKPKCWVAS